ncbi:NAD-dependent epimerase/dehydratase family protein [Devosia sp.]|uniref:NAD-dependent epimerase/dehydratase family protein n=1 Tax=Devosia sp. TaxID=1871048 RepID=UPI003A9468B8
MSVLVTGASGFVGRGLTAALAGRGMSVRPASRQASEGHLAMAPLSTQADWRPLLAGCDAVVHLAARVHHRGERGDAAEALYAEENAAATLALARQSLEQGVRRFVFVSSVKVHGDRSTREKPLREDDPLAPEDAYGRSKLAAERQLFEFGDKTGLEIVVVRPPLVHGPGVGANFRSLMQAVTRGMPLPFGAVDNRRSLVGLDNLCDFLALTLIHPAAPGEAFLVSDGEDVSTARLVRLMGDAVGREARLMPVPKGVLSAGLHAIGRGGMATRLLGDLQVDIGKAQRHLGWVPPVSLFDGLRQVASAPLGAADGSRRA